jgi:hypothetical protein
VETTPNNPRAAETIAKRNAASANLEQRASSGLENPTNPSNGNPKKMSAVGFIYNED